MATLAVCKLFQLEEASTRWGKLPIFLFFSTDNPITIYYFKRFFTNTKTQFLFNYTNNNTLLINDYTVEPRKDSSLPNKMAT